MVDYNKAANNKQTLPWSLPGRFVHAHLYRMGRMGTYEALGLKRHFRANSLTVRRDALHIATVYFRFPSP
jgi:hypothetical protein